MMADLGGILRRSLDAAVRPETSLRRELEFVRDYLRIEKYRLEERLQVRWSIDTGVLMARVPTMILQPLVENAVKHGIAEQPEGGEVTIRARRAAQDLELSVDDSGTGIDSGAEPGIGIRNVRRRLATQYGTKAGLEVTRRAAGGTVARLTIPLRFDGNTGDTQDDSMPAR
jgi:sensor histidine kinase YesM